MTFAYFDRVKETTATIGTGVLTLAGAVSGFRSFASVYANGDTLHYTITQTSTGAWEVGLGTWNTGGLLTRTTVLASSNAGAAVNLAAGTKEVFVGFPADVPSQGPVLFATASSTSRDAVPAASLRNGAVARLLSDGSFSAWNGSSWGAYQFPGPSVAPAFGAQLVSSTTGFAFGSSPASAGAYRMGNTDALVGKTTLGVNVSIAAVSAGDTLGIGDANAPVVITGSGSATLRVGASNILQALASTVRLLTPSLSFDSSAVAPSIIQSSDVSASVTCDDLIIAAQSGSGTTSVQAGSLGLKGGSATGASGTRNGGAAYLQGGTGGTADGYAELRAPAGTQRLRANATGLGLYAASPVAQAARVGQLTDSTTGTPSTTIGDVGVVFSQSTLNNINASLLAKINALELLIHNLGASA